MVPPPKPAPMLTLSPKQLSPQKVSSKIIRAQTMTTSASRAKRLDKKTQAVLQALKIQMTDEEIFGQKFRGAKLKDSQIFKSITGFSPTGNQKRMPLSPLNLIKFEQFLVSAKKYFDIGRELG